MNRTVEREWLDELPAEDPGAMGSRRDLRRLNWWMGSAGTMQKALRDLKIQTTPIRLAEIGAGDGDFLLRVARRLGESWRETRATLVDLQNLVTAKTAREFSHLGWKVSLNNSDVLDWIRETGMEPFDVVLANLFLHHFNAAELQDLLRAIQRRSKFFIALEPRRSAFSLLFSRLVGFIGCNAVTRHDAPASVRAGFFGHELSSLWRGDNDWQTSERRAGLFGHLFVARKRAFTQPCAAS